VVIIPHEWTTKTKAIDAAQTLCQIAKDNEGNAPHELIAAYTEMLATARPAITASFFDYLHKNCPALVSRFVGPAAEWRHDAKHDIALNEAEDMQQQITKLWEAVTDLRRDVDELKQKWRAFSG
jgi:hypothetical protein